MDLVAKLRHYAKIGWLVVEKQIIFTSETSTLVPKQCAPRKMHNAINNKKQNQLQGPFKAP